MAITGGDSGRVRDSGHADGSGRIGGGAVAERAEDVPSPTPKCRVAQSCTRMRKTAGDRGRRADPGDGDRNRRSGCRTVAELPFGVVTPAFYRRIAQARARVIAARSDRSRGGNARNGLRRSRVKVRRSVADLSKDVVAPAFH